MTLDALAVRKTLEVAAAATAISAGLGMWLGYSYRRNRWVLRAGAVPLALPPTILCGYLLFPRFPWPAAAAAGVLYASPFLLRSARNAFDSVDPGCVNAARGLGASEWRVFWRIVLPLASRPLIAAAAIVFARVASEFALTLWIATRLGRPLP